MVRLLSRNDLAALVDGRACPQPRHAYGPEDMLDAIRRLRGLGLITARLMTWFSPRAPHCTSIRSQLDWLACLEIWSAPLGDGGWRVPAPRHASLPPSAQPRRSPARTHGR